MTVEFERPIAVRALDGSVDGYICEILAGKPNLYRVKGRTAQSKDGPRSRDDAPKLYLFDDLEVTE